MTILSRGMIGCKVFWLWPMQWKWEDTTSAWYWRAMPTRFERSLRRFRRKLLINRKTRTYRDYQSNLMHLDNMFHIPLLILGLIVMRSVSINPIVFLFAFFAF